MCGIYKIHTVYSLLKKIQNIKHEKYDIFEICYPFPNNSIFRQLKNPIFADCIRKSKNTQWILKCADLLLSRRGVLTPYTPSSAVPDHILQNEEITGINGFHYKIHTRSKLHI